MLSAESERWRAVPSVPGLLASSLGRLMVVPRQAPVPNGGVRQYGGEPTAGQWDGKRFIYVLAGRTYKVHRLVCEAFHGAPPKLSPGEPSRIVCMHADENAANNRPENLAWGTQKQNLNAPGFIAYCRSRTGDSNPYRKGLNGAANGVSSP